MSYTYKGLTLTLIYGIDLSCNNLMGKIPPQIGNLTRIVKLNLSHNRLIGSIPKTFSTLKKIQRLDLSYNNLNGNIPPELVELNSLYVFNVAHNNLSGKTPRQTAKFITLGKISYEGNYLFCGWPLQKKCEGNGSPSSLPKASIENGVDYSFIDIGIFYISFKCH
ncbi:hypothetical protein Pint_36316 [Pistacia integerrima]|uniref:Uncharacterized protein n=1 Tax=Pistacia integerrima TaxID=434235 RepID=A0ACC0Y204_9ROSI|nr:hypothetical protein Pint_36316 [Pistacia integerrima]